MKICLKCNLSKELTDFCNRTGELDGKHRYCKLCMKRDNDIYYHDQRKHKAKDYYQNYRDNHKDYMKKYRSWYYPQNKHKVRIWERNRLKTDMIFRLKKSIMVHIYKFLKKHDKIKEYRTIKYLGCSIPKYKLYLESLFTPEMNWSNYGSYWEIDHIIPLNYFDIGDEMDQLEAFNWLNTQPLTIFENRSKSDKVLF